jgi:hypothetical protein
LTFVEEQVIALVSVNQYVYVNGSGGHMTSGHCINFAQDIGQIARVLPRLASEIGVVVFRKENTVTGQNLDLRVRRAYVTKWLEWLKVNGIPAYRNVTIDRERLANLPPNGELPGIPVRITTLDDPELPLPPSDQNEIVEDTVEDTVGGMVESLSRHSIADDQLLASTAEDYIKDNMRMKISLVILEI